MLELTSSAAKDTYYNLLVQGFQVGQLNLRREVPAGLRQLPDFYDPEAKSWLLDLSYYQGKLYLYFGVTPALALFWPCVAVTGHHLLHKDAVMILFSLGFLASAGLLWAVWRRYFAEAGVAAAAAGTLALGLANVIPAVLPRSDVFEVAISCGYALTMVTLVLVWQALQATPRRAWWLAAASLAYGLALGARPSLLFGAVILLVPVLHERRKAEFFIRPSSLAVRLAAIGPITVVGLGLLLYNYLRFDDPLEFGQRYQLPAGPRQQFSLDYFWFNFRVCFLAPAQWSLHFPFVHDIRAPALPAGHGRFEHPFGILANIPLAWLALAAPLAWHHRSAEDRSTMRWLATAVALLFGTCAVILCLHDSMVLRYELEFACMLVVLAVIASFGLERALAGQRAWRRAARWFWGLLLGFSVCFNLFAMLGLSSDYHLYRGVIASEKGQLDEAIVQFQRALKLQPENAEAHSSLGITLFTQGKAREAIRHLEDAVRLKPDYARGHHKLATVLFQQGKVVEAIGHLEQAVRLKPDYAEVHHNLALALRQQGKGAEAIGHLEQAVRLNPNFAESHNDLGAALIQLGRVPDALRHYQEAVRLKPGYANAHHNLGMALFQQGNDAEAVAQLAQALQLKPDDAEMHNSMGIVLFRQAKVTEAIWHWEQTLRLQPGNAGAHNNLGEALLQQGRVAEAISHYEQAVRLRPGNAETCRKLAWVLATCADGTRRNGAQAVELAKQANQLTGGKDVDTLDTLAAAYAEAGRYGEAMQTAQAALELAKGAGQGEQAQRIQERLQLYQVGRPSRQNSASER